MAWYNNPIIDDIWYGDAFDTREEAIEDGVRQYKDACNGFTSDLFDEEF